MSTLFTAYSYLASPWTLSFSLSILIPYLFLDMKKFPFNFVFSGLTYCRRGLFFSASTTATSATSKTAPLSSSVSLHARSVSHPTSLSPPSQPSSSLSVPQPHGHPLPLPSPNTAAALRPVERRVLSAPMVPVSQQAKSRSSLPRISDFKVVLSDFDGTLAYSDPLHLLCYNQVLKEFGISQQMSEEQYAKWSYTDDAGVLTMFLQSLDMPAPADLVSQMVNRKHVVTVAKLGEFQVLYPHVESLLVNIVTSKVPLCLVSMADRAIVDAVLSNGGVHDLFSVFVTAEDVTHGKPHPEPYQRALERLNQKLEADSAPGKPFTHIRPEECLVLEDTCGGLRAGKAFGATVLCVTHTTDTAKLIEAGADYLADTMADIDSVLLRPQ